GERDEEYRSTWKENSVRNGEAGPAIAAEREREMKGRSSDRQRQRRRSRAEAPCGTTKTSPERRRQSSSRGAKATEKGERLFCPAAKTRKSSSATRRMKKKEKKNEEGQAKTALLNDASAFRHEHTEAASQPGSQPTRESIRLIRSWIQFELLRIRSSSFWRLYRRVHGKNDFAERYKVLHQNNFNGSSNWLLEYQNFLRYHLSRLNCLYNYFDPTDPVLFLDQYLPKFLDISANHSYRV
ncbi:hypothetical protein ALC57_16014, partial [Trachymyrmex cornetzi]